MSVLSKFIHRGLSPFMAGASMAAITVSEEPASMVLLLIAAALFAFMSLPAGGRMIRRATGADHQG